MNVNDFAVELKIGNTERPVETLRGEFRRCNERIEGMRGSKVKISHLVDKQKRIVFIRGLPGAGKSVLVKQMTYKWADGELFQQFDLCITFECRELNYFVQNEGKKFEKHELLVEFVKSRANFEFGSKSSVLFIIDGLDELNNVFIHTDDSIIWQLLDVKMPNYSRAKLIITGRPHVEKVLFMQNKDTGGIRTVEIDGLSEEQIKEYVKIFASSNDVMVEKISRAIESSKSNLKPIIYPQILNSFCCVASISDELKVHNETELYCWSFYLLLKQHAEKDGSPDKKISDIFKEYSKDLLELSKICHELLQKNTIIFEGKIEFGEIGKGKEFLKGLFVDVSDDFNSMQQFKHLTLMEFLSAVYVCTIKNPTEVIRDIIEKRLDQVLLFNCQLIAGLMYDGIIKEMFKNAANLKEVNCGNFFRLVLTLVRECVTAKRHESFKLSIDVIMCLMNKDVINKQFILSIVNKLSFMNVSECSSSYKLIELMKGLSNDFGCCDGELEKAFENVHFGSFDVTEVNCLKFARFLASVDWIGLNGGMATITTNLKYILISISKCRNLSMCIAYCKLQDEDLKEEITECPELEALQILGCDISEQSFNHLCKLIIKVRQVELNGIEGMKGEWWSMMLEAIVRAKENHDGDFALWKLVIKRCPLMNDETRIKVITFILIHNNPNFIIICKWFNI